MRQGRYETLSRGLAVAVVAAVGAAAVYAGTRSLRARRKRQSAVFDYSDRSGFSKPVEEMRGIARIQGTHRGPGQGQTPASLAISP